MGEGASACMELFTSDARRRDITMTIGYFRRELHRKVKTRSSLSSILLLSSSFFDSMNRVIAIPMFADISKFQNLPFVYLPDF